jgi:hypothetical protein
MPLRETAEHLSVFYVVSVIVGTLVARPTKGIDEGIGELLDLNS